MVLSNKKLKQKIRATLAASALGSLSEGESKKRKRGGDEADGYHLSVMEIVGSSIKLPRFSKREKRRQKQSLSSETHKEVDGTPTANSSNAADKGQNSSAVNGEKKEKKKKKKNNNKEKRKMEETELAVEKEETDDGKKDKKKKKRKREEAEQKVEENETNGAAKEKNKKKKKKKIKKKSKEKEENKTEIANPQLEKANGSEDKVDDASTKVYVGGIPYYSSEDDIGSFFDGCGTITEMDCMTFPESGKFRGIAIITFKTEAAAKRALALDGADMGGLFLKIQPYRATQVEKTDFAPERVEGYNRIYMCNLSWDVTEEDIRNFFSDCKIKAIRFGTNKDTNEFLGYAHVDFADDVSLGMALTLDQQQMCGRPVKIRCAVPKKGAETKKDSGSVPSKASRKRRTCYTCGIPGHLSSSCPQKQQSDKKPSSGGGK